MIRTMANKVIPDLLHCDSRNALEEKVKSS